ncbi:MAG: YkgJ family cysteine cluster protein [Deltaproteobacteria bacterium]|nr:YkgJ family cysteine cluster protein [Deltaproteobacteria bacterium]
MLMKAVAPNINEQLAALVKHNVLAIFWSRPGVAGALEAVRQVHDWADNLISRFEAENVLPRPIACRAACDFCCYNQVETSPLEALAISHFIQELSATEQARLTERVNASVRRRSGWSKAEVARSRRQFPCPFLNQGLCEIYPVRPLLCRAMHSLDAGHCEKSLQAESLLPDDYYLHRYEIVLSINKGLTEGCREAGCRTDPLDLAEAVVLFLQNASAIKIRG